MVIFVLKNSFRKYYRKESYPSSEYTVWWFPKDDMNTDCVVLNNTINLGTNVEYIVVPTVKNSKRDSFVYKTLGIFFTYDEYVTDLEMLDGTIVTLYVEEGDSKILHIDTRISDKIKSSTSE